MQKHNNLSTKNRKSLTDNIIHGSEPSFAGELSRPTSALITDKTVIYVLFNAGCEGLITSLYEEVFIPPRMYSYFVNTLDSSSLKILKDSIKKSEFSVSDSDISNIQNQRTKICSKA